MMHECNEKDTLKSIETKVDEVITAVHKIDVRLSVAEYKLSVKSALFGLLGGLLPALGLLMMRFLR